MTRTAEALALEIKRRAVEAGFQAVGVAAAEALGRDASALEAWLAAGRHAGMRWMAAGIDRRTDPRALLPGCRSVITFAMSYWPGAALAATPPGRSKVALYARGRDYHRVLGGRLRALAAWLETESGAPARACVDTAPVLERAWAERAGIGWIGKNANLLSFAWGSWLLLGEVLSTAALPPDPGPQAERCGSCTACMEACPTGAIVSPGVVDSNRCISYWTIEHRGPVPEPRRGGNGNWIFGCDECQTACPWNARLDAAASAPHLRPRPDLAGLDPEEILALDETAFRERFSGTSIMRARRDGMRRNACLVSGIRAAANAPRSLRRCLRDPDPVVRSHAGWALARVGPGR